MPTPPRPEHARRRAGRRTGPQTFGSVSREQVPLRGPDGPLRARRHPHRADQHRSGPGSAARRRAESRGWLARFVDRFGWRAYAIPVLAVVTALGVSSLAGGESPEHHSAAGRSTAPTSSAAPSTTAPEPPSRSASPRPTASPTPTLPSVPVTGRSVAVLPAGSDRYTERGDGHFTVVSGSSERFGRGPLHRFTVEAEGGIDPAAAASFGEAVTATLRDPRSWVHGGVSLQRVSSGSTDFRVTLTSVQTIRQVCGYSLPVETSCYNSHSARVFINDARWMRGAVTYGADRADYRHYVINHEVGHALGHGHVKCPGVGRVAPIMMEQTLGLLTPGVGACRPNPWPYVDGQLATGPAIEGY